MITRVGVIGLGRMGLPMARHILDVGFQVTGFDIDPGRRAALVQAGGREAPSPRAVAEAGDAIIVMVVDDAQVTDVVRGADGVLQGSRPGAAVIIASTVKPATCVEVAEAARAHGVGVLDAPVTRGQRAAEAGTLTVLVGGERQLFDQAHPVFEAFSSQIFHVGEQVGAGQVAKMVNNLLLWTGVAGVHAYLTLAQRLGVNTARLRAALQASSADSYVLRELDLINLTWPEKDLAQAMEVAEEAGIALPLIGYVRDLIRGLTREDLRRLTGGAGDAAQAQDPAETG